MSADIGPGDVMQHISKGDRRVVLEVIVPRVPSLCPQCGQVNSWVLSLSGKPTLSCPRVWRKLGGSKADTVLRFAEDLNVSEPSEREPQTA